MRRLLTAVCITAILCYVLPVYGTDTDLTSREAVNRMARFLRPGDKVDHFDINFTSGTNTLYIFGDGSWDMDYARIFTEAATCSIAPRLKTGRLLAGYSVDTTYMYVPAGSDFIIAEQWGGFKLKGMGTGKLSLRAVGHVP